MSDIVDVTCVDDEVKDLREDFKSRFSFSSEDALRLGDSMIEHYLELTNESDKGDIVVDL